MKRKLKNMVLLILIISSIFVMNSTIVFAAKPHYTYNEINIIVFFIMRIIVIIAIIKYIIYFIKSIKKGETIGKLIMWLVITIIASIVLWYGANFVLEGGKMYTSTPSYEYNLPVLRKVKE